MRTVIDLLRQGNQELFHSAMISWLLNPEGEHGAGQQFLRAFADLVAERGRPELSRLLMDSPLEFVTTEHGVNQGRYDIVLKVGGKLFAIENKTKSVGAHPQLDKYAHTGAFPIALGLSDVSFSEEVRSKYPLVCYRDILAILERVPTLKNPFGGLVEHYRLFLRRELRVLDLIKEHFEDPEAESGSELAALLLEGEKAGYYTSNDIRFLNFHYLEMLKRHLDADTRLMGTKWESNKNLISGVFLCNHAALPEKYAFSPAIQAVAGEHGSTLWFHVELWRGVSAREAHEVAGSLQVKCWVPKEKDKREFVAAFMKAHVLAEDESPCSKIHQRWDTFSLVSKGLMKADLVFRDMTRVLIDFMCRLGRFGPEPWCPVCPAEQGSTPPWQTKG